MSAAPQQSYDVEELRALAVGDLEGIARELKGEPNKARSKRADWRWGTNGSFKLDLAGRKRGLWHDKEGDQGGDVFSLVMAERGCSFRSALEWLAARFSIDGRTPPPPRPAPVRRPLEPDPQEIADRARAIARAREMAHASGPIDGTVAETYLVQVRKIPRPETGWPDAIRFHAASRSLLVIATLEGGEVVAIQRVRLKMDGTKADGTPELPTKITTGRLAGALVRLPAFWTNEGGKTPPLVVVEAPESAIAVWASCGHEVRFVLGVSSLPKVTLPTGRRVVFARDDDPRESPADKTIRKALAAWKRAGADVVVATPWHARRFDKSDFADTVARSGPRAVRRRIDLAISPPDPTGGGMSIAEARQTSDQAVEAFFKVAEAFDPDVAEAMGDPVPAHAVRAGVGTGKSHSARRYAAEMLTRLREVGDKRSVAFAVPTHRLGSEQQQIFQETFGAHLSAKSWRGRGADDPASPGQKMCLDLEAVEDVLSAGLDAQTTVCRQHKKGQEEKTCPFFKTCGYQAQRRQTADLWIVPHELLFTAKPEAVGELAAVVVDEAAWQDGLEGVGVRIENGEERHSTSLTLSLDALGFADKRFGDDRNPDWVVLQHHRSRVLDLLRLHPDGPLEREAFTLSVDACLEAYVLEHTRKVEPTIWPGMPKAERREALKAAEANRVMLLRARFWKALAALMAPDGPARSGWMSLATTAGENGPQRVVHLKGRRQLRAGWHAPTLLIDALLDIKLVQPFWPNVELTASVEAKAPAQRVRQVTDRAFAKSRLNPLSAEAAEASPDTARARLRNLRQVRDIVTREARRWPEGRVLLVAQKGAKEGLIELGLPPNIEAAHHNNVAGQDVWKDVHQLIVVGRTQPRVRAVERMTEALTGAAVHPVEEFERGMGVRVVAGRGAVPCETSCHPDPIAEAIRWQICEGEILQIVGRGRGVNRSEANPLDVLVLTDPPLPFEIDAEVSAVELDPTLEDKMLGEGGVAFENPGHASAAYPDLWATRKGATTAFYREQMSSNSNEKDTHKRMETSARPLRRLDYQRAGSRHSPAVAWFDPLLRPDVEAWLTEKLGPLASCVIASSLDDQANEPAEKPSAADATDNVFRGPWPNPSTSEPQTSARPAPQPGNPGESVAPEFPQPGNDQEIRHMPAEPSARHGEALCDPAAWFPKMPPTGLEQIEMLFSVRGRSAPIGTVCVPARGSPAFIRSAALSGAVFSAIPPLPEPNPTSLEASP